MAFELCLAKESCKFSSAHFTIFSDDLIERLHGHNYYVSVRVNFSHLDARFGMGIDFKALKKILFDLTQELDEMVLVPELSTLVEIKTSAGEMHLTVLGKRYILPTADVKLLPVVNITLEELARYIADEFSSRLLASGPKVTPESISVTIEETRGQSVTYTR